MSTRSDFGDDGDGPGVGLLGSAAALRWSRPDLTGTIADHVLEISGADADHALWLRAAGWAVSARSATGDGRTVASEVLDGVARRGLHVIDERAADRLRVELAVLATGAGRLAAARALLTPVSVADTGPELRADALGALARCAVEDRPSAVDGLLRRAEETWAEIGGPRGHTGTAAASLVAATAERRAGRPAAAVERAAEGLAHLDRARGGRSQSPSRHLAAGLAAEWISGLLDAGRADEARDGCVPLEPRLRDTSRPNRQIALLRLAVARTVAGAGAGAVVGALTQAARDAAASDAPDLESVCLATLGALQEKAGLLEHGLESIRVGVAAQRRDKQRAERFRKALDAGVPAVTGVGPAGGRDRVASEQVAANGGRPRGAGHHRSEGAVAGAEPVASRTGGPWTDWSAAVARDRTSIRPTSAGSSNGSARPAADTGRSWTQDRAAQPVVTEGEIDGRPADGSSSSPPGGHGCRSVGNGPAGYGDAAETDPQGASPWLGWTDDPPIGHLLARSLEPGETSDAGDVAAPPSVREPQPVAPRASRREQSRCPDAVADPWSTGSWSMGHWASNDEPAGRRSAAAAPGAAGEPPAAAAGHGGRRRRMDPDDDLTGSTSAAGYDRAPPGGHPLTGPPVTPDVVDRAGSAGDDHTSVGQVSVPSRPSTWFDLYEQGAGLRAADRSIPDQAVAGRPSDRSAAAGRAIAQPAVAERAVAERAAGDRPPADRVADRSDVAGWTTAGRADAEAERATATERTAARTPAGEAAADRSAADRAGAPDRSADVAVEPGSGSWLQNALAELDRAWVSTTAGAPTGGRQPEPGPEADGCVVVLDLARDGRRFAGRRAGAVMSALVDRLGDRLPAGARLRHDDGDALSVVLPGWNRSPATEWMHRTLPGLFEEFVTDEDMPGTQLRAVVHDADGPVGAQLLQRLDSPRRRHASRDESSTAPVWGSLPAGPGGSEARPAGEGRRHRRSSEEQPESATAGQDLMQDSSPAGRGAERADSTDGLGLADLLAGALAAYRGI